MNPLSILIGDPPDLSVEIGPLEHVPRRDSYLTQAVVTGPTERVEFETGFTGSANQSDPIGFLRRKLTYRAQATLADGHSLSKMESESHIFDSRWNET